MPFSAGCPSELLRVKSLRQLGPKITILTTKAQDTLKCSGEALKISPFLRP
jgi:hypothetical protein